MRQNINRFIAILFVAVIIPSWSLMAMSPEEKGRQIMESIENKPTVEKMTSEAVFKIYDAQGNPLFTKKSRAATYIENFNNPDERLSRSITYFFAPADDKGNGALMIENPGDEEDDQWVYLKGLRKPKRVLGSDKSSSFMGSDFSNGDIGSRNLDDYNYKWLSTETIAFKGKKLKVEKIQAELKDRNTQEDYGYSKTFAWVHPQSGLTFKSEMYDLNGQLAKEMEMVSFTVFKNKSGQRVFMPTSVIMKSSLKGTKTVMENDNIKVENQTVVNPDIFDITHLTRRWW